MATINCLAIHILQNLILCSAEEFIHVWNNLLGVNYPFKLLSVHLAVCFNHISKAINELKK